MNFQEWIESQEFVELCDDYARELSVGRDCFKAFEQLKLQILIHQKDSLIEQLREVNNDILKGKQL